MLPACVETHVVGKEDLKDLLPDAPTYPLLPFRIQRHLKKPPKNRGVLQELDSLHLAGALVLRLPKSVSCQGGRDQCESQNRSRGPRNDAERRELTDLTSGGLSRDVQAAALPIVGLLQRLQQAHDQEATPPIRKSMKHS